MSPPPTGVRHRRDEPEENPEDSSSNPEDEPEDRTPHPEDIPRNRRSYNLTPEGRERLSSLGRERWTAGREAVLRDEGLARLQQEVQESLDLPIDERLREAARVKVGSLPHVTTETIVRVRRTDYQISEDGRLIHRWWPSGKRTEFEDGQWFQFGGKAYRIRDGKLATVPPSTILAHMLDQEG